MMIGQRTDAGAQANMVRALGRGGNKHLGRGNNLQAGGMMLADPGFVIAQFIETHDQFQVAFKGEGGVLTRGVKRSHKNTKT